VSEGVRLGVWMRVRDGREKRGSEGTNLMLSGLVLQNWAGVK
jgi:hypothetical protein